MVALPRTNCWYCLPFPLVLMVFNLLAGSARSGEISASGGGIVKIGEDLTLTYTVEKEDLDENGGSWDDCYWFWEEETGKMSLCVFKNGFPPKLDSCRPDPPSKTIRYSNATDLLPTQCQITVTNATAADGGSYSARLGSQHSPASVEVMVAVPVQDGTLRIGGKDSSYHLVAGRKETLLCVWPSSRPAPTATLVTPGFNVSSILSDNVNHSPAGSDGLVETTLTVEFVPDASHHGKAISCKAEQHNGDQRLLYESETDPVTLNVTFPPQENAQPSFLIDRDGLFRVRFLITANPEPTEVKWMIANTNETFQTYAEAVDDNDNLIAKRVLESGALTVLDPGQEDEKYQTSEIIKEGEVTYRMELRLKKTSTEDEAKQYRLEVTNSVGKEIYIYHLLIEGADDGGDNGGKDSGGGDNEGGEGGGGKDDGDDGDDGSGDLGGDGGGGDEEGGGDENGGGAGGDGEGGGGGEGGGDSDRGGNNGNGTDEGGDSDGTDEGGNSDGPDVRSGGATEMSGVTIFLIVLAVLILICALAALAIVFYQKGKWGSSEITPAVQTIS